MRGDFPAPICLQTGKVSMFPPFRIFSPESPGVEFGTQFDWIVGDPFLKYAVRLQETTIMFLLPTGDITTFFEIEENPSDRTKSDVCSSDNIAIWSIEEVGFAEKDEHDT